MAHSKSALKRWRQSEAHHERNKGVRTAARSAVKKARTTIESSAPDEAQAAIREATAVLDRAAKRKIIHPNAASRSKSRMMRRLNKATGATGTPAEAPKKARKTTAKAKPAAKAKAPVKAKTTAKAPAKPRATKPKPAAKS